MDMQGLKKYTGRHISYKRLERTEVPVNAMSNMSVSVNSF